MQESQIIKILNENELSEIEVLKKDDDFVLINFYFDFDKDVVDAAKSYSNEESSLEEYSKDWYKEYYFPYLYDFANDEVLEIIEEIVEELGIEGEMMAIQMTEKTSDYVQFMALFTEEDSNISIEEAVKDYMSK